MSNQLIAISEVIIHMPELNYIHQFSYHQKNVQLRVMRPAEHNY